MGKDNFIKDSFILTCSNLITGILKFMFSIILSAKLGSMGMGLYSLIMPIYDFFAVIVCGGMVTATSKQCAYYYQKNDLGNLHKSVRVSLVFDFVWSVIICLALFSFSPIITNYIIKDTRALYSLWLICPAIIFVALSGILKGYFYGTSRVMTPALIDILEKTVRMLIIVSIILVLNLTEITKTVTVTYLALSVGELASLILLFIFYEKNKKHCTIPHSKLDRGVQLLFNVLTISLPLCINGILTTGLYTISTLLLPRRLMKAGMLHETALSAIGNFSGMAMAIIFFPFIVVTSISTMLVPDISKNLGKGNHISLEKRFFNVINVSFILGLATFFICSSIPNNLGQLFFKRNDLGSYIKFASLCAPFMYVSTTTFGILNGLGKQKIVLKNSLISAIEELLLIYILASIPSLNIYGYGISIIVSSLTISVMNILEIKKDYSLYFSKVKILIYLLLGILIYFILNILNNLILCLNPPIKNLFLIALGFGMYIFSCSLISSPTKNKGI